MKHHQAESERIISQKRRKFAALGLTVLGAITLASLATHNPSDVSIILQDLRTVEVENIAGAPGAIFSFLMFLLLGVSAFILPVRLISAGVGRYRRPRQPPHLRKSALRTAAYLILPCPFLEYLFRNIPWRDGEVSAGGVVGRTVVALTDPLPGWIVIAILILGTLFFLSWITRSGRLPDFLYRPLQGIKESAEISWLERRLFPPLSSAARDSILLAKAFQRKERLVVRGYPTAEVEEEILGLRRQIRDGRPQLRGDVIGAGRFRLLQNLGSGGFGEVWKAYDRATQKVVAAKILHKRMTQDRTLRERFFRGARTMSRLQHHGIPDVIEQKVVDDDHCFYVLEYCSRGDLRKAVLANKLSRAEILEIIIQAAAALHFAHERGILHRDVKPSNILIDSAGGAKITDFDLVFAPDTTGGTRTGMLGTVVYAAPEAMLRAASLSVRADVYGLGATAVFALYSLDLPLDFLRNPEGLLSGLEISDQLRDVLRRAVAWKPENRYADAASFSEELRVAWAKAFKSDQDRVTGTDRPESQPSVPELAWAVQNREPQKRYASLREGFGGERVDDYDLPTVWRWRRLKDHIPERSDPPVGRARPKSAKV